MSHLTHTIEQAEKELIELLENQGVGEDEAGHQIFSEQKFFLRKSQLDLLKAVEEVCEGMKLPRAKHPHVQGCVECKEADAYNAALNDLQKELREARGVTDGFCKVHGDGFICRH